MEDACVYFFYNVHLSTKFTMACFFFPLIFSRPIISLSLTPHQVFLFSLTLFPYSQLSSAAATVASFCAIFLSRHPSQTILDFMVVNWWAIGGKLRVYNLWKKDNKVNGAIKALLLEKREGWIWWVSEWVSFQTFQQVRTFLRLCMTFFVNLWAWCVKDFFLLLSKLPPFHQPVTFMDGSDRR